MPLTLKAPSPLKILAVFGDMSWFLAALYLRNAASRDSSSVFFEPSTAFEPHYSTIRQRQAEELIGNTTRAFRAATTEPRLCVGVASVQRDERYFRTAVGSLLEGLGQQERDEIRLVTLIANSNPQEHPAFNEAWLGRLSDQVLTYRDVPKERKTEISRLEEEDSEHRVKASLDYTYVLESCAATGAQWTLMLEDDILAADGWYYRTKAATRQIEEHPDFAHSLYVRLFYTSHLLGWNSEEWILYLLWTVGVTAAVIALLHVLQRYHKPSATVLTIRTAGVIVCIYLPSCILLFFAAGRLTVAPLAAGVQPMNQFGCCSQALVFPRHQIPSLIGFYRERRIGFVDVLTEEFADEPWYLVWFSTSELEARRRATTKTRSGTAVLLRLSGILTSRDSMKTTCGKSTLQRLEVMLSRNHQQLDHLVVQYQRHLR